MATNHITPFPNVAPMPFMPSPTQINDELLKTIRGVVESTIIDVMDKPGDKLGEIIKKHVKESMECKEMMEHLSDKVHHHMRGHHDKSDLEYLYCEIIEHHKHIAKGKSIFEIEGEIAEEHKDLSPEETRVLSCLLRSDGPVRLAGMINMDVDDFIDTMKHLGKRFKEHKK